MTRRLSENSILKGPSFVKKVSNLKNHLFKNEIFTPVKNLANKKHLFIAIWHIMGRRCTL